MLNIALKQALSSDALVMEARYSIGMVSFVFRLFDENFAKSTSASGSIYKVFHLLLRTIATRL